MKEEHLKLFLGEQPNHKHIEAVAFGMRNSYYEDLVDAFHQQKPFKIVYHLDINEFNGRKSVQARIIDIGE